MNKLFLILIFNLFYFYPFVYAQSWQAELGDEWYKQHQDGLKVGDKMPDIPLGTVINNYTGKARFKDFRGKIVILDFWSTYCSTCMDAFPKMEKLQNEFGDQIQIFLVNTTESQEDIEKRIKKTNELSEKSGNKKLLSFPDLPSIVAAKELQKLFPYRALPHHVWIGKDGVIKIRGSMYNANEQKIREMLAGNEVNYMKDAAVAPLFNQKIPYYTIAGKMTASFACTGSFFTRHNNEYAALSGGVAQNIIDSTAATVRNTFVNCQISELYNYVFNDVTRQFDNLKIINYPLSVYKRFIPGQYTFFLFNKINDTLKYTSDYTSFLKLTDRDFVRNRFCYEQILPLNIPDTKRKQYMLDDLNRYFGDLYGTKVRLEKHQLDCYVLVRTAAYKEGQVKVKDVNEKFSETRFTDHGTEKVRYTNAYNLGYAINRAISNSRLSDVLNNYTNRLPIFVMDETGIEGKVNIVLSADLNDISDLKNALNMYGIDIVKAKRAVDFVVIAEN